MERNKEHFIGLDLAQRVDFSAYAVVTAVTHIADKPDPVYYQRAKTELLRVRDAAQCPHGLAYSKIPEVVCQIRRALGWDLRVTLAVDATGLGMRKGVYTIGRQTLLANLRVALEIGVVRFPGDLHCRRQLIDQIVETSIDAPGREHDDLVFALALAVVAATTRNPSLLKAPRTGRERE